MTNSKWGTIAGVVTAAAAVGTIAINLLDRGKEQKIVVDNVVKVEVAKPISGDATVPKTETTYTNTANTSVEIKNINQRDTKKILDRKDITANVLASKQIDVTPNLPKNNASLNTGVISTISQPSSSSKNAISSVDESIDIKLFNKKSKRVAIAGASVSVLFGHQFDQDYAKLTVLPLGRKPKVLPVLGSGQQLEFESKKGEYVATVLNIDFEEQLVEINVSRKN